MNFQPSAEAFVPEKPWRQRLRSIGVTRHGLRKPLMIGVPLLVIAFWFWFTGGRYVSTDNTYIHAAKMSVEDSIAFVLSNKINNLLA